MNWKNITTGLLLASLSIILPLENSQKTIAQEVEENTTIEEVEENTNELIGQTVSVRGEIEDLESGLTFVVSEDESLGDLFGEDEVLVVNTGGEPIPYFPQGDMDVQITGVVSEFILTEVENEYGLDLDPELYVEYENQPVILAESIAAAPEPGDVTKDPESYYDQRVAIEGEVEDIIGVNTFTLDEDQLVGGSDLIVVNLSNEPLPAEDEIVTITGVIRPFVKADLERDYDLQWDLDVQEKIEAEYSELPVLVVDSIYPSAQ